MSKHIKSRLQYIFSLATCLIVLIGCRDAQKDKDYSGNFFVISGRGGIVVKNWNGFEYPSPPRGIFKRNAGKSATFPRFKDFPKRTTVLWTEEGDETVFEQELDLVGIVPAGSEGETRFELSEDGKWSVSFERERSPLIRPERKPE